MATNASDLASPKRRRTKAIGPSVLPVAAGRSPTAGWSLERWGTAVAARVYVEMHQVHAADLRGVDPQVRRSLGRVIRQEVERAIAESVADAAGERS